MTDQPGPGWPAPPSGPDAAPPELQGPRLVLPLAIGCLVLVAGMALPVGLLIAGGGGDPSPGPIATVSIDNETADDVVVQSDGSTWVVHDRTQVTSDVGDTYEPTVEIHILTATCSPLADFTWTQPGSWLIRIDASGARVVSKDYQRTGPPDYPWVPLDTCGPA